ncbi:MAG: hypothetical protein JST92_11805 [Deltaproteobacteria bacterium]|nr:hypothetical protein [Deltaproteobacteria bacterium]
MANADVPAGSEVLRTFWALGDKTTQRTWVAFENGELGKRLPQTLSALGDALVALDRASSCGWGCHGGEHVLEHMLGTVVSSSSAACRLMFCGAYDEALILVRTIGETCNLLYLFALDKDAHDAWAAKSVPSQRFKVFRPKAVQERLKALGAIPPINRDTYGKLSEFTHGTKAHGPQAAFNPIGLPVFGVYQQAGPTVILNELALAVGFSGYVVHRTLGLPAEGTQLLEQTTTRLIESIGNASLSGLAPVLAQIRDSADFEKELPSEQPSSRTPKSGD